MTLQLLALTLNSLHALDKMPDKPLPLVKAAFEWKAMALAGYEPLIDNCGVCGAPLQLGVEVGLGGVSQLFQ